MNHNYVVMTVVLLVWAALFFYLLRLEKKVDRMLKNGKKEV
ncbi:MAG: CcmD family protein [candidate division Zixibacteria bacterium]|nr:CcmD family protein [candidate division Zixibacteria bacterium]MCI0597010.1 CcmD family protein [candidate division Zixibacteria bacterium]